MDAIETVGVSIDGTGQVGTYFYTAPEIEQGWPKINEKVLFLVCTHIHYIISTYAHLISLYLYYRLTCTA